jgi:hypothetical protein
MYPMCTCAVPVLGTVHAIVQGIRTHLMPLSGGGGLHSRTCTTRRSSSKAAVNGITAQPLAKTSPHESLMRCEQGAVVLVVRRQFTQRDQPCAAAGTLVATCTACLHIGTGTVQGKAVHCTVPMWWGNSTACQKVFDRQQRGICVAPHEVSLQTFDLNNRKEPKSVIPKMPEPQSTLSPGPLAPKLAAPQCVSTSSRCSSLSGSLPQSFASQWPSNRTMASATACSRSRSAVCRT